MSILALTLTLCSAVQCDDYIIDHTLPGQAAECNARLVEEAEEWGDAWVSTNADARLTRYLSRFNIQVDPRFVFDYDFTCQLIAEDELP
ncbi:hypothetical protein vBPaerPsIn_121 [Pseudomonas phage vB_Paer_PsIn]|uniref:Uncharacterized protein n=1 Tax=Pseudomonas phage vB_Paer_PsIn TaxID=2924907 RepID=A0AAE9GS66_9CAUD|nr:hypothetical protein QE348_gp121 [Pseudomonas phage vB_Paer_PsIn]UOL48149.1 hypothetical protein vBPaerPsIn_121 [Pseudomonas phage vB_Paer_PsIn]